MRQNCTSLFVRQALLVFVTVAGTVLILSTVGYKLGRQTIRKQIGQRLLVTCADRATMLEMFVDQQRLSARCRDYSGDVHARRENSRRHESGNRH